MALDLETVFKVHVWAEDLGVLAKSHCLRRQGAVNLALIAGWRPGLAVSAKGRTM